MSTKRQLSPFALFVLLASTNIASGQSLGKSKETMLLARQERNFSHTNRMQATSELLTLYRSPRNSKEKPVQAQCVPTPSEVPLAPDSKNPSVIYYPISARINQCGCNSCCHHGLLECRPIAKETKKIEITKQTFTAANSKKPIEQKVQVEVEVHTKCKCDCSIKESDCKFNQVYVKSKCACECQNVNDRSKCLAQSVKIWDSIECTCKCTGSMECTTGTFYDEDLCECREQNDDVKKGSSCTCSTTEMNNVQDKDLCDCRYKNQKRNRLRDVLRDAFFLMPY